MGAPLRISALPLQPWPLLSSAALTTAGPGTAAQKYDQQGGENTEQTGRGPGTAQDHRYMRKTHTRRGQGRTSGWKHIAI